MEITMNEWPNRNYTPDLCTESYFIITYLKKKMNNYWPTAAMVH